MINKFVEHSSCKELAVFILTVSAFQAYFNDFWLVSGDFRAGYSIPSFINIYCFGRFLRLYKLSMFSFSRRKDLFIWLCFVICIVFNAVFNKAVTGRFNAFAYNNPFVIGASVYFFLFFTKLTLTSSWGNRIAASAFSVFLLHCNIHLVGAFKEINQQLYTISVGYVFLFLVAVYISSVLIDQVRILSFKLFCKKR